MSFPIKNGGSFHSYVAVYQRVTIKNVDKHNLTIKAVEQKPLRCWDFWKPRFLGKVGTMGLLEAANCHTSTSTSKFQSTQQHGYPLVNQHSYWQLPFKVDLPTWKWWFSIVMSVYQRVKTRLRFAHDLFWTGFATLRSGGLLPLDNQMPD